MSGDQLSRLKQQATREGERADAVRSYRPDAGQAEPRGGGSVSRAFCPPTLPPFYLSARGVGSLILTCRN